MPNRRDFLAASGVGLAALGSGGWSFPEFDSTWLAYAPDAERFWANLPFLERLKKIGEAGFTRYEFGRWKTKDYEAIAKANEELGLDVALFAGYSGLRGPKWKEGLLDAAEDSAGLASKLRAAKAGVVATDRDEAVDRADQVDDLVEALKEAIEKLAESELVLILEPVKPLPKKPAPLIGTVEEAAEVVKAVGSDRLKLAFPIDRNSIASGMLPGRIAALKAQTGYYRLVDFAPPSAADRAGYVQVLRAIHDAGYSDPIGLGLAPKGDPLAAIEAIRKLDEAAKAGG
jgi:hydroxypyruvate isomerase